jgi:CheY-like chemotaxis protein
VTRAATLKEAMLRAATERFDVAILDYRLPDGDGLELLDALRRQRPELPVLFLTGQGSEGVAMRAMERGASDFLVKTTFRYDTELPRRVGAVLQQAPDIALARGLLAPAGPPAGGAAAAPRGPAASAALDTAARSILQDLARGPVRGAALLDGFGQVVAAQLPSGMVPEALGAAVVGGYLQQQVALRCLGAQALPRVVLSVSDAGCLAASALPGGRLLVLVLEPTLSANDAVARAQDAARKVWERTQ